MTTTITSRISSAPTESTTKRVGSSPADGSTIRITTAPVDDTTKRVLTAGAVAASGGGNGGDTWARTWGNTWGRTWYGFTAASGGTDASPAVDVTRRIGSAPTANNTKRVTL